MALKIVKNCECSVLVDGTEVYVVSQKKRWRGDSTQPGGYWLRTHVFYQEDGREKSVHEDEIEITHEFHHYAELKHQQIVQNIQKCGSLEEVAAAVKGCFPII